MNQTDNPDSPYILINSFTPKPGQTDAFLDFQLTEMVKLRGPARNFGWLGNEIYRTEDDKIVIVTRFKSRESHQEFAKLPEFQDHRAKLDPFLEDVQSQPAALIRVTT